MKIINRDDLVVGKIYRNPINTVKFLYTGTIARQKQFKIIKYFNGDCYAGKNIGDTISSLEESYYTFNYFIDDNITFGR